MPLEHEADADLAVEAARAHNRMMADYCAIDRRLLPTAYIPLVDRARAVEVAKEAIALGCKGTDDSLPRPEDPFGQP